MSSSTQMSKLPVALITGTNSGVGLALAVKMAADHMVFAGMRGLSDEKCKNLHDAATAAGVSDNLNVIQLDVCDDSSVKEAVGSMLKQTDGRCGE